MNIFSLHLAIFVSLFSMAAHALDSAAIDSTGLSPQSLTPSPNQGYYLQSGSVELYCDNGVGQPSNAPSQYRGWSNCTTPVVTDSNGSPITCADGYAPNSAVSFAQADSCKGPSLSPISGGGQIFMLYLSPPNGTIHWVSGQVGKAYVLCFSTAYSRVGGNSSGWGNPAIIVNYSIFCRKCTPGTYCYSPSSTPCPSYKGPATDNNAGVWPLSMSWGTGNKSAPWCNCTGSCPSP